MGNSRAPILVVEDVESVLDLLAITLRFRGYPVYVAKNGEEALEVVAREHPPLVITDILMPKMDGFELAYRIRKNPRTRNIRIIFLSATYTSPEDRQFAINLGATRFIEKPVDAENFLLTVAEVLTEAESELPQPMDEDLFYLGYRERLDDKLKYKNAQIARTEHLIRVLPSDQRPDFEALLEQLKTDCEDIRAELDRIEQEHSINHNHS